MAKRLRGMKNQDVSLTLSGFDAHNAPILGGYPTGGLAPLWQVPLYYTGDILRALLFPFFLLPFSLFLPYMPFVRFLKRTAAHTEPHAPMLTIVLQNMPQACFGLTQSADRFVISNRRARTIA